MKNEAFNKLQHEINKRVKVAADSLLNNDQVTAKENVEWIQLATDLVDKIERRRNKIRISVIIGLLSVFLIGLGFTVRMPRTKVAVDVITKNTHLILKKNWTIDNRFSSSELNISNLREVYWAGANIKIMNEQPFAFELKGQDIVLDKIVLDSSSELTIQLRDGRQNFIIKSDSLGTDVQVGKAHLTIGDVQLDTLLNSEIPQIFKVKSFKSRVMPVIISLSDTARWSMKDILISDISFSEESVPGTGKFISSIASGRVKILEIDKEVKLEEGDWLLFKGLNISRIQITKANSDLKIHIEGAASDASVGSELLKKKLNPTIIEYLYYAKSFAFFWSCIIFIWSLLWSLKVTLFSK